MEVNNKTIEKLENLSMLEIQDKEEMKSKLGEVLSFMENLKEAKNVEIKESNKTNYREDRPEKKEELEDFFEENEKVVNGSFEVPKIL